MIRPASRHLKRAGIFPERLLAEELYGRYTSGSMVYRTLCCAGIILFTILSSLAAEPAQRQTDNPHIILRSLVTAYPEQVTDIDYDFDVGDWYVSVNGTRLYWAEGRLLPRNELHRISEWRPYVDYLYPDKIPHPEDFSPDLLEQLNSRVLEVRRSNAKPYNITLYDLLYDGATRRRIEANIIREDYLGKRVSAHRAIFPRLRNIEARIYELAARDQEVREFLDNIQSIEGYNWREVADRPLRSNHSWGLAIDIMPRGWKNKNIYWHWISQFNDEWMLIPPDRRWAPPDKVIEIFEAEGFIWGGKWLLWDTIHFEYRPELLVLRRWGYVREE